MQPVSRKLVTIVTEALIEKDLTRELENLGVLGYTITDARGRGSRGTRDATWEHGASIRLEIICDDTLAEAISEYLRKHYYEKYAMVLFVSDVSVLRAEKF